MCSCVFAVQWLFHAAADNQIYVEEGKNEGKKVIALKKKISL